MLRLSVKCDELRNLSDEWRVLKETYPDLPERLRALGIDDVEASISLRGEARDDAEALARLETWYVPWERAGMGLHLHPYTFGRANPAAYDPPENAAALDSLLRAAECLHRLTERGPGRPKLVYHAAEAVGSELGRDPRPERAVYAERSRRFFHDAWTRIEAEGRPVQLVVETQVPPEETREVVRIGDRPDEISAMIQGRRGSVCLDTGHYLVSMARLGNELEPGFLAHVAHMHLHDVDDLRDHRALTARSHRVAGFVRLCAERGRLTSATLEYKLHRGLADPDSLDAAGMLEHLLQAAAWIREWAAAPGSSA